MEDDVRLNNDDGDDDDDDPDGAASASVSLSRARKCVSSPPERESSYATPPFRNLHKI